MNRDKTAKHIVASTCTLIALAILEVAAIGATKNTIEDKKFDLDYRTVNTRDFSLNEEGAYAEYVGKEYGETASDGYTFYRIYLPVENYGTCEIEKSDLYISVKNENYSDTNYFYSDYSKYDYISEDIVPSGREGYATYIVQVKDEVEFIKLSCEGYSDNETAAEYMIELPRE